MSRKYDSSDERIEFENTFESPQVTDQEAKETAAVSTAKTMHHSEKITSKSKPFSFRERDCAPENATNSIHMNPVFENKFIENDNVNCHIKNIFENIDNLEEDGDSTCKSNNGIFKNDFISYAEINGDLIKGNTSSSQSTAVHKTDILTQESPENTFIDSLILEQNSHETNVLEEQQATSCSTTFEIKNKEENTDISDSDSLRDEPDYFDSEDEFLELNENSCDELQMTPFYVSQQEALKRSSTRNEKYYQLKINGEFNHSAESLRQTAIRYLRSNPYHSSGCHLESFLSSETWDDYLTRMEKTTEWGDHMMLKALSDSLILPIIMFNVYEDDIHQTEITPYNNVEGSRSAVYLGHIGEFHYLSLRPLNWEWRWPYKALVYRLLSFHQKYGKESVISMVQERIQNMGIKTYITDANLANPELLLGDEVNRSKRRPAKASITKPNAQTALLEADGSEHLKKVDDKNELLKTYCLQELQLQENGDSLRSLVEDPFQIDVLTGIPMPHLSYMIRLTMPSDMIVSYNANHYKDGYFRDFIIEYVGSLVDGTVATLEDCTKTRKMFRSYTRQQKRLPSAILHRNVRDIPEVPVIDTSDTHPGYCRLKLYSYEGLEEDEFLLHGNVVYLKAFKIPTDIGEHLGIGKCYAARHCSSLPVPAREWRHRSKPFNWPKTSMMSDIEKFGCNVIQSPHPDSESPSIEWKFNFSYAEKILSSRCSLSQRYAFYIFKIIIDKCTWHLDVKLKNKHLKSVFFYACEKIPLESWYRCLGGCILYVLASLVDCLKRKCIPHYFIPSNNIIDYYSSEQIETICVYVETARVFPIETIQFFVEKHGYKYGSKLAGLVFDKNECLSFANDRSIDSVSKNIFIPNTIRVTKFLAKLGYYGAAYTLMKDVFENFILNGTFDLESGSGCPSFMTFLQSVLQETRDKTTRIALATIFDKECGTTLTSCYKRKHANTVKEVVPFEIDNILGEMEISDEHITDLSSIAAYLDKFGYDKYKQGNAKMAGAACSAAIQCINHLLNEEMIDENEIKDDNLKAAILSEKESMNSRLFAYHIYIYLVSVLRYTITPLINFIFDIEKHCERYPSMASIVSEMWFFLNEPEKGREYLAKAESLK